MFIETDGKIINLDHVYFIKKDKLALQKDGSYLLYFQFNTGVGYMTLKYDYEKDRDDLFNKVMDALGDRILKA